VTVSFAVQKLFSFMQLHQSILFLRCWLFKFYSWGYFLCLCGPGCSLFFPGLTSLLQILH
jgi:hypothetical protein